MIINSICREREDGMKHASPTTQIMQRVLTTVGCCGRRQQHRNRSHRVPKTTPARKRGKKIERKKKTYDYRAFNYLLSFSEIIMRLCVVQRSTLLFHCHRNITKFQVENKIQIISSIWKCFEYVEILFEKI